MVMESGLPMPIGDVTIDMIKPYVKQMSDKCIELGKDLSTSVDAYERGDATGATRFH